MVDLGSGQEERHQSNKVLDRFPEEVMDRLAQGGRQVRLLRGAPILAPHQTIETVGFLLSGAGSILSVYEDGSSVAVGMVGNEGVIGMPAYFDTGSIPLAVFAQMPSIMLAVPARLFREELQQSERMQEALARYAQALVTQLAVSAGCNALHLARQRLSRWILMMRDRTSEDISLSHEALGQMLGLRRATIGDVASSLQREGLISYQYGRITVTDREGLEQAVCECYWSIQQEYGRLLGA